MKSSMSIKLRYDRPSEGRLMVFCSNGGHNQVFVKESERCSVKKSIHATGLDQAAIILSGPHTAFNVHMSKNYSTRMVPYIP